MPSNTGTSESEPSSQLTAFSSSSYMTQHKVVVLGMVVSPVYSSCQ